MSLLSNQKIVVATIIEIFDIFILLENIVYSYNMVVTHIFIFLQYHILLKDISHYFIQYIYGCPRRILDINNSTMMVTKIWLFSSYLWWYCKTVMLKERCFWKVHCFFHCKLSRFFQYLTQYFHAISKYILYKSKSQLVFFFL